VTIGDASWERPASGIPAWLSGRTVEYLFWVLLLMTQVAWIAGLVALGLWLA
jgi:hypothetical protein